MLREVIENSRFRLRERVRYNGGQLANLFHRKKVTPYNLYFSIRGSPQRRLKRN